VFAIPMKQKPANLSLRAVCLSGGAAEIGKIGLDVGSFPKTDAERYVGG